MLLKALTLAFMPGLIAIMLAPTEHNPIEQERRGYMPVPVVK